jgi:NAD(P)-dependent dehydrogenase (short-subunit alcohol dehydrogenase family)
MGERTALVTGAAAGIGAAIAGLLAGRGYRVALLDRDGAAVAETADGLGGALAIAADVTDEGDVARAFDSLPFVPDLVVNNAGIVRFGLLAEQSVDDFRQVIAVNLEGAYIVAREAVQRMLPRGDGHVVSLTSINAYSPGPGAGAYPASKSGVLQLMRQFALEYGEQGIRFNSIAPGFIDGGMSAPIYADPAVRAARSGGVPLKRLGTPEDIAEAVAFLDSPAGAYVNGHDLVVDGGVSHAVLKNLSRK